MSHPKANEEKRQVFIEKINGYQESGKTIVFVDESGYANNMPRRNGYAPIGERCFGKHNWNEKGRTNVIGAIIGFCLITVFMISGTVNSNVFLAWVEQDLLPKLPANCVIVMDNASFHKRLDIQQAITNAGHIIEYLPAYSPDLNPIERKWAQTKAIRRREQCDVDHLFAHLVS